MNNFEYKQSFRLVYDVLHLHEDGARRIRAPLRFLFRERRSQAAIEVDPRRPADAGIRSPTGDPRALLDNP